MATFKPAYLIHGDDHGRIAERRARLRALAEAESGPAGIELLEGERATPDGAAAALQAMTFALGRRFVIVDGVERWRDGDLDVLKQAMHDLPPDTTVAFFAREEGRRRAPAGLRETVKRAGGDVSAEGTVKGFQLPRWAAARARELGLELEGGAAKALVARVGERQQRLLRELEKLALEHPPGTRFGVSELEASAAASAQRRTWALGDALVAGDAAAAIRLYLELRGQGERVPGLLYQMTARLRQAAEVAGRLEAGEPVAQVRRDLRMPSGAAERLIADVGRTDAGRLRRAIERMADLELASRGARALGEDTAALRAIAAITTSDGAR
jgi:DNA polymerase-3 subunit delta